MPAFSGPPRFPLGQVIATPGALAALTAANIKPWTLLFQHERGNWGDPADLEGEDWHNNEVALRLGGRLLSAYVLTDRERTKVWVITEADRSVTTLLLPSEY